MARPHPLGAAISRRTVLKGIGAGIGCTLLLPSRSLVAQPGDDPRERLRAFVYLDHAGRSSWVIAGALFLDDRRPRQLLRRAKRARLPREVRSAPEAKAAFAPPELAQHLYNLLAKEGGLGLRQKRGVEIYAIHLGELDLQAIGRDTRGHVHLQMVRTLLEAMDLSRFPEVLVYYNLPSVRLISRRAYRAGIEATAGRAGRTRLAASPRRPLLNQGHLGSTPHLPGERHFPDDAIQVSDFVAHAFLRKLEGSDLSGATTLGPVVKAEIDAASVPAIVAAMA
jgi:hypothetical protein